MLEILYYPDGSHGPVAEHLVRMQADRPKAYARIKLDLDLLGVDGLRSRQVTVRPLGAKLWELKRLYEGIQYRLFFVIHGRAIWLLHSLEKKSAKTPKQDLELARSRLREVTR